MFIQTEDTPNPQTLKFIPGEDVLPGRTANFLKAEDAAASPLATRLFRVADVVGVFLGGDFISVTKEADASWDVLKPLLLGAIMEHYGSGQPVMRETTASSDASGEDDEIVVQIKELLDTRIRPAVAQDGGDIIFERFEGGIVYLQLHGACSGCPSATVTLKNGVENMLKHYIPEIVAVEAVA